MKHRYLKRIVGVLCLALACTAVIGCSTPTERTTTSGLRYETKDQYMQAAVLRYPMTDERLRYTLYDICAIVTECLTNDESVTIPATVEGVPVIAVAAKAFCDNKTMKKLVIGSNILQIDDSAFQNCTALTSVQMSGSVNTIGSSAFAGCIRLKNFVIPAAVDNIPSSMFSGCESLKKAVIESRSSSSKEEIKNKLSARTVGDNAFSGCASLVALWIPVDVTTISGSILSGERRTVLYGEEKSAAARFAAEQRLDYGVTTRDLFDAAVRAYNPLEEDIALAEAGQSKTKNGYFEITYGGVCCYKQIGNRTAGEDRTLMAISFSVKNTDYITHYFDGFDVTCKSWCRNAEGIIMPYLKRPHYFISSVGIGEILCGSIGSGDILNGTVVVEINTKAEYVSVLFDGADDTFYIR